MTFEELLDKACMVACLPNTARMQLPRDLSDKTKKKALKYSPEDFGRILKDSIDEINRGSVDSVDLIVRKAIDRWNE